MLASADVYRPAAIAQLKTLAQQLDVECFDSNASQKPLDIANATRFEAYLGLDTLASGETLAGAV